MFQFLGSLCRSSWSGLATSCLHFWNPLFFQGSWKCASDGRWDMGRPVWRCCVSGLMCSFEAGAGTAASHCVPSLLPFGCRLGGWRESLMVHVLETQKLCVLYAGNSCGRKWWEVQAGDAKGSTVQRKLPSGQPEGGSEKAARQPRGGRGHWHRGRTCLPGGSPQVLQAVFPEWPRPGALRTPFQTSVLLLALCPFCLCCSLFLQTLASARTAEWVGGKNLKQSEKAGNA